MIHSVWNLCRACPGKADEKIHTEYKRNYTWHSNYQPVQQDVIKKPPDQNASALVGGQFAHHNSTSGNNALPSSVSASAIEPPLPRKKRHPEVAYRNHQVLNYEYPVGDSSDSLDCNVVRKIPFDLDDAADFLRARSEERGNSKCAPSGPRSRSADPSLGGRKAPDENKEESVPSNKMTEYQLSFARRKHDGNVAGPQEAAHPHRGAAGLPSGLVKRHEHRTTAHVWQASSRNALLLQQAGVSNKGHEGKGLYGPLGGPHGAVAELHEARKSISMGAIAHGAPQDEGKDTDNSGETPKRNKGTTEYKAKFRPFSSYLYVDGNWRKTPKAEKEAKSNNSNEVWDDDVKGIVDPDHAWYTEVVERIKKADEYRWRAHGTPLYGGEQVTKAYGPGGAGRQAELWSQVHDRTSLVALSLACSPKSICRGEEKTPDRFKAAHKSPTAAGVGSIGAGATSSAPVHRRDIRPVSAERKKSPAAEKKNRATSDAARKSNAASRPARFSSVNPIARSQKVKEDGVKTGVTNHVSRASSAEPTSRSRRAIEKKTTPITAPTTTAPPTNKKEDRKPKTTTGPTLLASRKAKSSPTKEANKTEGGAPAASRPRPVVRPAAQAAAVNGEDGKIWLKPKTASKDEDDQEEEGSPADDGGEGLTNGEALSPEMEAESSLGDGPNGSAGERRRPCTLPAVNGVDGQVNGQHYSSPSPLPEPHTGPVPLTTVRSPEEVTGVKSPDPESWTIPLETNKGLEWTDGHTPAGIEAMRVKSPPLTYKSHQLISSPQSSYGQDGTVFNVSSSEQPEFV